MTATHSLTALFTLLRSKRSSYGVRPACNGNPTSGRLYSPYTLVDNWSEERDRQKLKPVSNYKLKPVRPTNSTEYGCSISAGAAERVQTLRSIYLGTGSKAAGRSSRPHSGTMDASASAALPLPARQQQQQQPAGLTCAHTQGNSMAVSQSHLQNKQSHKLSLSSNGSSSSFSTACDATHGAVQSAEQLAYARKYESVNHTTQKHDKLEFQIRDKLGM